MAVFDAPEMTSEQYDRVLGDLENAGLGNPDGRLHHVASVKDGGMLIVDVWESEATLRNFSDALIPIIQGTGAGPAEPQLYPVHNIIS